MNKYKEMNQVIKFDRVDFKALVDTNNCDSSLNFKSKIVDELNNTFTDDQKSWCIGHLYMYLNYHPTNDYPIDLENVWKLIGFSHKANAKRTLINNFVKDEDYKISLLPREQRSHTKGGESKSGVFIPKDENLGGRPEETILLNVDTFKNLCMITKTEKAKEIRMYYVKLENIFNKLIKEEIEENKKQLEQHKKELEEKEKLLLEKDNTIKHMENKPDTYGFERSPGYIYFVEDTIKPGHIKLGYAIKPDSRVSSLNVGSSTHSLKILTTFETFDKEFSEKMIHHALHPFRIKNRKEWFYFKNKHEIIYALNTIKKCIEFITMFDTNEIDEVTDTNLEMLLIDLNKKKVEEKKKIKEIQKEQRNKINKTILQKIGPKTGIFKGVCFCSTRKLWCAQLAHNNDNHHLGYFSEEIDAAKVYNDYASYLNEIENTHYYLNDIPGYVTVPRNIPQENKNKIKNNKTSKYIGVSYDSKRKYYVAGIRCAGKTYNLGNSLQEIECAKLYNQQALFFNNTLNTDYKLNDIENYTTVAKDFRDDLINNKLNKKSSKYYGVSLTTAKKWSASYMINRKKIHIGTYNTELEACVAYNKTIIEVNKNGGNYKVNII